jgi:hypothetical protein
MAFPNKLSQLCTPSLVYFVISIIGLAIAIMQNLGNNNRYNLGSFSCQVPSCVAVFIIKVVYVLFWTWILNLMCRDGHVEIAWFLVLLPFILLAIIIGLVMANQKKGQKKQKQQKQQSSCQGGSCQM